MNKSLFSIIAAAAILAACNGTNNGFPGPGPTSGPVGNCGGPPASNQLQVVYPIPGSKNVSGQLNNVYIATKGTLPPSNQFDFFLTQSNGNSTYTSTFATVSESQIPNPHSKPKYANPTYYVSAIAGPYGSGYIIGPHQSVNLLWNDGGRNCNPHFLVAAFRTRG